MRMRNIPKNRSPHIQKFEFKVRNCCCRREFFEFVKLDWIPGKYMRCEAILVLLLLLLLLNRPCQKSVLLEKIFLFQLFSLCHLGNRSYFPQKLFQQISILKGFWMDFCKNCTVLVLEFKTGTMHIIFCTVKIIVLNEKKMRVSILKHYCRSLCCSKIGWTVLNCRWLFYETFV